MIGLREFLKEYNLGLPHFAQLIGVSVKSLIKYEKCDETLTDKPVKKIERGLRLLVDHNLVAPKCELGSPRDRFWWNTQRRRMPTRRSRAKARSIWSRTKA